MPTSIDPDTIVALAARVNVIDGLLFRRVSPARWAHLGGIGRGRGWAGLVDVDTQNEPLLVAFSKSAEQVQRFSQVGSERVIGPYYAQSGAFVRISNDVVVVLANPAGNLASATTDRSLHTLALALDANLEDIAPSKRLGDELEVLHAVRAVTQAPVVDMQATLEHCLEVAVRALSCEVGILRDGQGRLAVHNSWPEWEPEPAEIAAVLDALSVRIDGTSYCLQDVRADVDLLTFGLGQGIRSLLVLQIPPPVDGVLVLAHTSAGPRGFTSLCRQLGNHVAEAAGIVAHTAVLRDELSAAVDTHARAARVDALTDLGNRLAWDEAVAVTQDRIDDGVAYTVVTLDVDGLKAVNDSFGHAAGDRLLRRCADAVRGHAEAADVVVRLGGDEFAMLLPGAGPLIDARVSSLRSALSGTSSCEATVVASIGIATAAIGTSLADAVREADARMYQAKRARRALSASTEPLPTDHDQLAVPVQPASLERLPELVSSQT